MTTGCLSTLEDRHPINLKRYMNSKLDYPILIAGFSGPGMVGSISANYIVEQMHMRQISYVESEFIMPTVIYIGGNLRHSLRK